MDEEEIPDEWRPTVLITNDNAHHLLKNEVSRNKRLTFVMEASLNPDNRYVTTYIY